MLITKKNPSYCLKIITSTLWKVINRKENQTSIISHLANPVYRQNKNQTQKWAKISQQIWKETVLLKYDPWRKINEFKEQTWEQKYLNESNQKNLTSTIFKPHWNLRRPPHTKTQTLARNSASFLESTKAITTYRAKERKRVKTHTISHYRKEIPIEERNPTIDQKRSEISSQIKSQKARKHAHEKVQLRPRKLITTRSYYIDFSFYSKKLIRNYNRNIQKPNINPKNDHPISIKATNASPHQDKPTRSSTISSPYRYFSQENLSHNCPNK